MTHYDVLQVTSDASPEVIRMAYKALVVKYHPDKYQGNKEFAETKMKQINQAYHILSSPSLRQRYDQILQQRQEETQPTYRTPPPPSQPTKSHAESQGKLTRENKTVLLVIILVAAAYFLVMSGIKNLQLHELPEPQSGKILSGSEYYYGSEITIHASSSESCVVKLKTRSGIERLSFYVRAGDTVTIGVPDEFLYVYFASGETWYGEEKRFGSDTTYQKTEDAKDFTEYTWEFTLYRVNNGNLTLDKSNADEFD